MPFEGKKNADKWIPVRLVDSTDHVTPVTNIVYGDVTCTYGLEGAESGSSYSVATGDWKNQGLGNYWLNIGASEFIAEGKVIVNVAATGCDAFAFVVEVRDLTIAELIDLVVAVEAKTTNLPASPAATGAKMDLVDAPNGTAIAAVQNGLATGTALTTVGNNVGAVKTVTDNVAGMYETDGPVKRYTANALEQAPTGVSTAVAEDIADAVWDEDKADHDAAGSMGELQGDTDLTVRELGYQRPP